MTAKLAGIGLVWSVVLGCTNSVEVHDPVKLVVPAVSYHPLDYSPVKNRGQLSPDHIKRDIRKLRRDGFRSVVTYSSAGVLGQLPEIARQEGLDGTIIMGIWDPGSVEEMDNAISQANFVDGYCVGNEGLGVLYETDQLNVAMTRLRDLTGKPVTTSEPIERYLSGPYREWLIANSDWMFPLAHPFWANQVVPEQAVSWILARHDFLAAQSDVAVMIKEAGVPTAGANHYDEQSQIEFFEELESTGVAFFYFEAFDQPWKRDELGLHEVEAYWGLYRADGAPKQIISWIHEKYSKQ